MKTILTLTIMLLAGPFLFAQTDSVKNVSVSDTLKVDSVPIGYLDTALRITNLNPYFTLHVDSILNYDFNINHENKDFFWFLVNSPVGVRIGKNDGNLYVKAEKALFKTGRLKYDIPYRVQLGVQNLHNPTERIDTAFTILFYSTEVIVSKLKPSTSPTLTVEEGDSIQFRIQCEEGSFPIEQISINSSMQLSNYTPVKKCNDEFKWIVPFGIFRENDTAKQKMVIIDFIGSDKFYNKDTASIKVILKPGINFPYKNQQHERYYNDMYNYIQELKLTFYVLSSSVKKNKTTRTSFDIGSSSSALAGTIVATTADPGSSAEQIGKIMPSIGLTLIPVKEAVAPNKIQEQNTASQVRAEVKRLDYIYQENRLNGDRDTEVLLKTKRLQDELKKSKLQFIDLPIVEYDEKFSEADADKYFEDPKVNKKYKLKVQ
jgi:hypothetical protein